jgi:hypothetical protein
MERVATYLQALPDSSWQTTKSNRPKPLTYDEKKAAEAAFQGASFNPAWSQAAIQIYEGITAAMIRMGIMWFTPPQADFSV